MENNKRLKYGPNKYAALNLMLARWARNWAVQTESYAYITLGGTEFFDVANLAWVDRQLVKAICSYESSNERYALAKENERRLVEKRLSVRLVLGDIFDYARATDDRHIYFIDLEGTCRPSEYRPLFQSWFQNNNIRPDDFILITSYSGRNPGWEKVLEPFDAEFRFLQVATLSEKQRIYKLAHPLFVLYEALQSAGMDDELKLDCVGVVAYKDKSPMRIYGIVCQEGETKLETLVRSVPYFEITKRNWDDMVF